MEMSVLDGVIRRKEDGTHSISYIELSYEVARLLLHARGCGNDVRKIMMPKVVYDMIDPELIAEKEKEFGCKIIPVERKLYKPERKRMDRRFRPQDGMRLHKRGHKHKRRRRRGDRKSVKAENRTLY